MRYPDLAVWSAPGEGDGTMYCTKCGYSMNDTDRECPRCSAYAAKSVSKHAPRQRSKAVAGWLAILGWPLGLHYFYLGRPWLGVLLLFLFLGTSWTVFGVSVPFLWGVIHGVCILGMSDADFQDKYGYE